MLLIVAGLVGVGLLAMILHYERREKQRRSRERLGLRELDSLNDDPERRKEVTRLRDAADRWKPGR